LETPPKHSTGYRPEIDGLRCLAVVPVILYHAQFPPFGGGYVGVDVFFVISGYLITSIILADLRKGRFSFGDFYERRVRRIFPALFVVTLTIAAAAFVLLPPMELRAFGQSVVATMAFLANLLFYQKSGYFAPNVDTYPLIHVWSLAVEEQFYLFFPIVLLAVARLGRKAITLFLVIVCITTFAACVLAQAVDPSAAFFLTPFRGWELGLGALIAANNDSWRAWLAARRSLALSLEAAGLAMLLGAMLLLDRSSPFPGWLALPPVLGTAFIIAASSGETPVGRALSARPLVLIGLLSYSAYLWHQPLFALARSHNGLPLSAAMLWGLIALTFLLAWLSWRFVESPLRNRAFLTRRRLFALAGGGTLLLFAIGGAAHLTRGFPDRFPAARVAIGETIAMSPKRGECHTEGASYRPPGQACRYLGAKVDWAVLGDSHAIEIGFARAERLRPQGRGLLHLSFSSCPPALDFDPGIAGCRAWLGDAVGLLERSPEIHDVLLAFRHGLHLYGDQREAYPRAAQRPPLFLTDRTPEAAREAYWASFEAIVRRLRAAGKRVTIMAPVPELPASIEYYVFTAPLGTGVPRRFFEARQGEILRRLTDLAAREGATLIEPQQSLCATAVCAPIIAREAMYFDDNHLSLAGARRVAARAAAAGRLP
jgi:peptidoglycan/LPS O-acetylase OafA/YrhL